MKNYLFFWLITLMSLNVFAQDNISTVVPLFVSITPVEHKIQSFKGNDKEHVAYELIVTNFSEDFIRIQSIIIRGKVDGECKFKLTIDSQNIPEIYSPISGDKSIPHDPLIPPGESGILFLFLDFSSLDQVPEVIQNILQVEIEGDSQTLQEISSNPISINTSLPIVIHPPLEGDNWYIAGGVSNTSYHRRTVIVLNGNVLFPERYAVDFEKFGPQGLFQGDYQSNESFYGYGKKVLAVSDGKVIRVVDGLPDNIPGQVPPITDFENLAGNYVLMKLDSCHYALYAHLIPGSLKVKKGDCVYRGQVLGLLGNSGNSIAPHLHFQITDRPRPIFGTKKPYPLNAQGLPWVLNHFINEKYIAIGQNPVDPDIPLMIEPLGGIKVKKQILMDKNLVDFGHKQEGK